jgi:hypothetical protein
MGKALRQEGAVFTAGGKGLFAAATSGHGYALRSLFLDGELYLASLVHGDEIPDRVPHDGVARHSFSLGDSVQLAQLAVLEPDAETLIGRV